MNSAALKILGGRRATRQGCAELARRWRGQRTNEFVLPDGGTKVRREKWRRIDRRGFAAALASHTGFPRNIAGKLLPYRNDFKIRADADRHRSFLARLVGFYRDAEPESGFRSLRKLVHSRGRWSRTGRTYYPGLPAEWLADSEPGPATGRTKTETAVGLLGLPVVREVADTRPRGRDASSTGSWDRWTRATMRRAAVILRNWDTVPSYAAAQAVVRATRRDERMRSRQSRPHRAAVRVAAATLALRFGWPADLPVDDRDWREPVERAAESLRAARAVLAAFRLHRQPGAPSEVQAGGLDAYGPMGEDDRVALWDPVIVAASDGGGAVITERPAADRMRQRSAALITQVVVPDVTSGHRHHLTVPGHFALPLRPGESAARRVHAAVAWTFRMNPDEYRPGVEA